MADGVATQVKERTDIVALISEHMRLKRTGANFKGLCPFHHEDTPSFVVSPSRQMFHCFGCGESGDVFSWLMKRESMTFPEALRVLAQRAGITLTFERAEKREERDRLRATLDTAADFYHAILLKTAEGREARDYLRDRGISEESIARFRLGFVPVTTTPLLEKAKERGVTQDDLLRAGIFGSGARGPYERFYGRILFPLSDHHGSVVGFAGRILREEPTRPAAKYVNSPETILYTKGRILYGLDRARDAIRREDLVVLVEGYTDVIASHQAGVEHVVATSGTALTDDHLTLIARYTKHLAFAFDADEAGQEATRRAIDLAVAAGFAVSVVLLPSGDDPADLAVRDPAAWRQAITDRRDVLSFLLDRARAGDQARTAEGKQAIANDLLPLIARMPHAVARGDALERLARTVGVEARFLREELERFRVPDGAAPRPAVFTPRTDAASRVRREERLLALFFTAPATFSFAAEHLPPEAFTTGPTRALYDALLAWYNRAHAAGDAVDFSGVHETLPEDLRRLVDVLQLALEVEGEEDVVLDADHDARTLLRDLLAQSLRRDLQEVTRKLPTASPEEREHLLQEVARMTEELSRAEQIAP
jgi:DNA primase